MASFIDNHVVSHLWALGEMRTERTVKHPAEGRRRWRKAVAAPVVKACGEAGGENREKEWQAGCPPPSSIIP